MHFMNNKDTHDCAPDAYKSPERTDKSVFIDTIPKTFFHGMTPMIEGLFSQIKAQNYVYIFQLLNPIDKHWLIKN